MRGLVIIIFLWAQLTGFAQSAHQCHQHYSDTVYPEIHFQNNADQFKDPVNTASTAFSELKDVKVEIRRKEIKSMMAARPKLSSFFKSRDKREYVIIISNRKSMNANALYTNMTRCAQVGVLGHELCHILSYEEMTNLELIWFAIKYVFNKKEVEAETDLMAIKRGFGTQIIEFNSYLHQSPITNKKYLRQKKKYYLSVNDIEQKMQENL